MRLLDVEYDRVSSLRCGDEEATLALARDFAERMKPGTSLALTGDLGAGKTTWVRGMASYFGLASHVHSPSYSLLHVYTGPEIHLRHFDLYRLSPGEGLEELGLEEAGQNSITLIEWPERLPQGWRFDYWVHLQRVPMTQTSGPASLGGTSTSEEEILGGLPQEERQVDLYQCKTP